MTNYDGRCRGGWAFGQGFDSPQVHKKVHCRVKLCGAFFCCFVGKSNQLVERLFGQGRKTSGGRLLCADRSEAETDSPTVFVC